MLSRKIITRRGRRFRGKFPSTKLGRMVAWESLLEKDALLLLELSPGIVSYQEQPTVIQYHDGCQVREYYPDFELILADGTLAHLEIKPSEILNQQDIHRKYSLIAEHYLSRQFEFRIITELEIRREPRFSNLELLAYAHAHSWHPLPTHHDLENFFQGTDKTLYECERILGAASTRRLIAVGKLTCDLDQPLAAETTIHHFQGEQNGMVLF